MFGEGVGGATLLGIMNRIVQTRDYGINNKRETS